MFSFKLILIAGKNVQLQKHSSQGHSYKMIVELCNTSYATVNTHVMHIYDKLHVYSVSGAIQKANQHTLI